MPRRNLRFLSPNLYYISPIGLNTLAHEIKAEMKKSETRKSAEIVISNPDLLMEILARLPIKSLFRFKCVSVHWLYLITTPHFSQLHSLKNATVSTAGLFLYQHPSLIYLSLRSGNPEARSSFGPVPVSNFLKITPHASNLTILSSCGGLLLCLLVAPPWYGADVIYFVCNPTTKNCNLLPPLGNLAEKPIVNIDLAFDPRESCYYKVVCMRNCTPPDGPVFEIQLFSSKTGSWTTCEGPFYNIPPETQFHGGIYWNKSIHYLNSWGGDSIYFHVETESLKLLPIPPIQSEVHSAKRSSYLGESGGHLHLVDIQTNITRESAIDIYELKKDYSEWFVRYRVDLSAIEEALPEMVQYIEALPFMDGTRRIRVGRYHTYSVVSVVQEEGGDTLEMVLSVPNKIIRYNPRSNESKVLAFFGDDTERAAYQWPNVIHYTQTLAPV